jgi:hypothetical protein
MQIGIVYPQTELRGDPSALRKIGLAAEDRGFGHLLAYAPTCASSASSGVRPTPSSAPAR